MGKVSHGKNAITLIESVWSTDCSVVGAIDQGVVITQILATSYRINVACRMIDYPIQRLLRQVFNPVGREGHFVIGNTSAIIGLAQNALIAVTIIVVVVDFGFVTHSAVGKAVSRTYTLQV